MNGAILAVVLVATLWVLVLLAFARPLRARWREPVFRHPLLVIESDDWGAGPLAQAEALREIAAVLESFRDSTGRHPVMTLGLVFEVPDTERMAREGSRVYCPFGLDDACFDELRGVIRSGVESRVFVPQLHGQCHYWPQALMAAAQRDDGVRDWLTGPRLPQTEKLPRAPADAVDRCGTVTLASARPGADDRGSGAGGGELSPAARHAAGGRGADHLCLDQ